MCNNYRHVWQKGLSMKKHKSSISQKKILDELKKAQKRNVTFSLNTELLKEFKDVCDENEVSMNETIEKLIEHFLSEE